MPFLEEIGGHIGMAVRKVKEQINARGLDGGVPKIRLLLASLQNLPTKLMLPKLDGDFLEQNLEFSGLLNQYFHCKQLRRFLQQCPKRKNGPRLDNRRTNHVASQEGGMKEVKNGEKKNEAALEESNWMPSKGKLKMKQDKSLTENESMIIWNKFKILQNQSIDDVQGDP